jgi:DNA-binding transcriptional ArsR family regulator
MYNFMVVRLHNEGLNQLFRALGDTTRRDILRRTLLQEVSVSGLADEYAMSFAAVQKHVAVLERAGLVTKKIEGRERFVRAAPESLARARQCLEALEELWRHRLNALDSLFQEEN